MNKRVREDKPRIVIRGGRFRLYGPRGWKTLSDRSRWAFIEAYYWCVERNGAGWDKRLYL